MAQSNVEFSKANVIDMIKEAPVRVLHVDDDAGFLKTAKPILELQGAFQVDTASSVEEAWKKMKKVDYDVVVSDYQIPGKDGLQFLKELREKGNSVPFIVFTGKGREEVAIKALNLGADRYIDKHGDPETVYCELAHGIRVAVERKKAVEALFAERDRLETVTRSIGAGLAIISKDYRTLWANDVLKQIFGDVEGKICYSTYNQRSCICPKCGVRKVFETEKNKVVHEQVGKDVDGKAVWSEITATPIKDKKGNITAAVELVVPMTERKRTEDELREATEKVRVANEKLRVVGGLTRHDVRNKLTAITGNAYLARRKLPGNSEILDYLKQIETSVEQAVRILEFAKAYEMLGAEELAYVDVEKTVNEAVSLFSGLKDIQVVNDCHGLTVLADSLLRTLFYNLVDNSLKYGEKLSRIRVIYEEKNDDLNVIYEDDGIGIPQAAKPKLFDQGYATGKGSGYGLFLTKKTLEVYGWTIEEKGEPGKGAQFVIKIPRTNKEGKENYQLP